MVGLKQVGTILARLLAATPAWSLPATAQEATLTRVLVSGQLGVGTTQRIRSVGCTESYYTLGTVPLTREEDAERFTSWEDIDQRHGRGAGTARELSTGGCPRPDLSPRPAAL